MIWRLSYLKVLTDHSNWEARVGLFDPYWQTGGSEIFLFHFKGTPSQDQQKTFRRRLITFKVTLTGQSHFMQIFLLRKVTLRGHINSLKWPPHPQPPWTKGGGTPSPAVEGPIRTTGEKAWLSVHPVLCTKETQNPPTKWILLYTVHCTVYSRINSVKSLYAVTPTP